MPVILELPIWGRSDDEVDGFVLQLRHPAGVRENDAMAGRAMRFSGGSLANAALASIYHRILHFPSLWVLAFSERSPFLLQAALTCNPSIMALNSIASRAIRTV